MRFFMVAGNEGGNRMKRILTVFLAVVMLFALCGCGKDTSLSDLTGKKVTIAGVDMKSVPFGYQTESGAYAGFDLDLAQKVASKLGVTLNLRVLEDEDVSDLLAENTIDFLAGNQSLLVGDERGMLASDAIFVNKIVVAVSAGAGVENIGQLAEKTVGVVAGSAAEMAFDGNRELSANVNKKEFSDSAEMLAAISDGSVDAIVADEMFVRYAAKNGASILTLEETLEERPYSIMVGKGDKALKERINEILFELAADGTLQDLSIKWFGADIITLKSLKDGWIPGAEYTIETGEVAGSSDAVQKFSGETLKFKTVAADTSSPAIIWSSIPNGATKVDSANNEIIIRTSGQELKTVSNENVVVKKDGIVVSGYTVSNFGRYGIIISDISLEKGAEYTVSVSGLVNKNGEAVQQGTYTITFNVRDDIYVDAQKYVITKDDAEGKTAKVMAELWNETEGDINYKVIGALKDNAGKILSVDYGSEGTLTAGDFNDVEVEVTLVEGADNYTLYIWDGIGTMKPLTDKISFEDADRTYGYDNYVNNEPLTIGFIGGSITNQGNYTTPLKKYLNEILDADARGGITYIDNQKSGVGGTGSDLGVYRIEKDIIKYNPDIVFIEFAVNDGYKADATEAVKNERLADIENLVRQLMELPHQPMVIMLDLTTKSLQENRPVIDDAENFRSVYGIENVDVAKYLWDNTKTEENPDGRYVWSNADVTDGEIALTDNDAVHPNAEGGKIYADYMNEVLAANPEKFFKKMNTVENAITESNYSNPRMISWREAEYNAYWKETKDVSHHMTDGQILPLEGAEVTFKFTGSTIGLYRVSGNPDDMAGTMEYSIDGGDWVTVSAYENLNYWRANKVIFSRSLDEDKEHTITLRAKEVDEKRFGFGYFIVD